MYIQPAEIWAAAGRLSRGKEEEVIKWCSHGWQGDLFIFPWFLFIRISSSLKSHLYEKLVKKQTTFYFSNHRFSLVDINSNFLHVTSVDFSKLPRLGYLLFFFYDRKIIRQACLFQTYRREQMWQKLMSFPRNRALSEKHERRSRNFLLQLEKTWSLISQILRTQCANRLNISCSLWVQVKDKNKSVNLFVFD